MPKPITVLVVTVVALVIAGCRDDENKRLAAQAEKNLERQAAQELRNADLHREVAEGTKRLVAADAAAREDMVGLHRDFQAERSELDKQRDQLEVERREVAAARSRNPLIAEAIKAVGLMIACAAPLLIAWQVLRRSDRGDEHAAIVELLLEETRLSSPQRIPLHDHSDRDKVKQPLRIGDGPPDRADRN